MAGRGDFGSYIPTTQVWDVNEIYSTDVSSREFKELIVRLYQNINTQALSVNGKDTGIYDTSEFVNGQTFPSTDSNPYNIRQVFRMLVNFGALPNNATKSVAHGITVTDNVTFTRIYGTSNDLAAKSYIPLPYASATGDNIELYIDDTNVNITTGSDWSAYTTTYIVLEYLKQ